MRYKRLRRMRAAAADFADNARERAEDAFESAVEAAEDGLDEAYDFVRRQWDERPVAVAATALAAGLVIGMIIGSRR